MHSGGIELTLPAFVSEAPHRGPTSCTTRLKLIGCIFHAYCFAIAIFWNFFILALA